MHNSSASNVTLMLMTALLLQVSNAAQPFPLSEDRKAAWEHEIAVSLTTNAPGGAGFLIAGQISTTPAILSSTPHDFVLADGDVLSVASVDGSAQFLSEKSALKFSSVEISGWQTSVPKENGIQFLLSISPLTLHAKALDSNRDQIKVALPDGATALLGANASAVIDPYPNGAYLFAGQGSILATNADGMEAAFSGETSFLMGGPLGENPANPGRLARTIPTTDLKLSTTAAGEPLVRRGDKALTVPADEGLTLHGPGYEVQCKHNLAINALALSVTKGVISLSIEGVTGWKALAWTGQRVEMQWDQAQKIVDLKNTSADQPLVVHLPSRTFANVSPNATFQYAHVRGATFATAASGGSVLLYNPDTNEKTPLEASNLTITGGRAQAGSRKRTQGQHSFGLAWEQGAPLRFDSPAGFVSLPPKSEQTISYGPTGRLRANFDEKWTLSLDAIQDDFLIRLMGLNGIGIEIPESNKVSLSKDQKNGTFALKAGDENSEAIKVVTSSGYSLQLPASTSLNFNFGKDGSVSLVSANGKVIFYEGAGGNPPTGVPGIQNPGLIRNDHIDGPRVTQPPASPFN